MKFVSDDAVLKHHEMTFEIYKTVFKQFKLGNISSHDANKVLGGLLSKGALGWRVIGITHELLRACQELDFKKMPKGAQRAHLSARIDNMIQLMELNEFKSSHDLFKFWQPRDVTILGFSKQNKTINTCNFAAIENSDGHFFTNAFIGYKFSAKHEGMLLNKTYHTCLYELPNMHN